MLSLSTATIVAVPVRMQYVKKIHGLLAAETTVTVKNKYINHRKLRPYSQSLVTVITFNLAKKSSTTYCR